MSHPLHGDAATSQIDLVKRRLFSGGAWALGGRVMLAFIGLATNALLARLLAPAELGVYFLAYSAMGLCAALGAMGLPPAMVRFVAESVGLEQYDKTRRAISLGIVLGILGATVAGLAYLFFGGRIAASLFDSPALAAVAGVTAGWISISILQGVLVEIFRGFHDIRLTITLGGLANGNGLLTGGLLSLMLLAVLLFKGEASLFTVLTLASLSGAASALLAGVLLRRRVSALPQEKSGSRLGGGQIMHVAWPLMVTTVALFVLVQASLWIAGAFLPKGDVALYGAAYRLMAYVAVPLQIASMVTPPLIAEMYAQGRRQQMERTLRTVATIASIPALLALAAFVVFGGPIMSLLFGNYYRDAALMLALLSVGQMVYVLLGACDQALNMTGHQLSMMLISIITGVLTVAGAFLAVQHYGANGVAAVAAAGLILQKFVMLVVVKKKLGVWTHVSLLNRRPQVAGR